MKVFIELDALVSNIYIEELFFNLYQSNFGKFFSILNTFIRGQKFQYDLQEIPYRSKAIHLIFYHYKNSEIVIVGNKFYEKYIERIIIDLKNLLLLEKEVGYFLYEKSANEAHVALTNIDVYIGSSLLDFKNYRIANENNIITDLISYCIGYFAIPRLQHLRNLWFFGSFSIPFIYSRLFYALLNIWPILLSNNFSIIKDQAVTSLFFNTFILGSFFALLKDLLLLQKERIFLRQGKEILCGHTFIDGDSSIKTGLFYLIIFYLILMYLFIINPIIFLISLIPSIIFFIVYLRKLSIKLVSLIASVFFNHIIFYKVFRN